MLDRDEVRGTIVNGTVEQIKALIDRSPDVLDVKFEERNGLLSTALRFAVESNDPEKVELLIGRGASKEQDYLGLLHHWLYMLRTHRSSREAMAMGDDIIGALVESGINFPSTKKSCDRFLNYALDDCFRQDEIDLLDCLLRHGFDPVACEKTAKACALSIALMYVESDKNTRVAKRFMELGCDLNSRPDYDYTPPLLNVLRNGVFDTCRVLIAHGANCKLPLDDPHGLGVDLVYILARYTHIPNDLMVAIFDASVPLDYIYDGDSLMHLACHESHVSLMEHLLLRGLDINSRNKKGDTPIMYAARLRQKKAVLYLIKAGADLSLTNKNGATVLDIASRKKNFKTVCKQLVAAGATSQRAIWAATNPTTSGKSEKKIKLDQYCLVDHVNNNDFNQAILAYYEAVEDCYWNDDEDDDLETLRGRLELLGDEVTTFLDSFNSDQLPSVIRVLSLIEILPVHERRFFAIIKNVEHWLDESDLPIMSGEQVRALTTDFFKHLCVKDVVFKSQKQFFILKRELMSPVVDSMVESIVGKTTSESVLGSLIDTLNPKPETLKKQNEALQAMLAEDLTEDIYEHARLKPETGAFLTDEAKQIITAFTQVNNLTDVDQYIDLFVELTPELVSLDECYQDGNQMHPDNVAPFEELKQERSEFLHDETMHSYFCRYYRSVLGEINCETHLGSVIQRFDHAMYFSDMLIGFIGVDDAVKTMVDSISCYEDFEAWANYFVLQAYRQVLEDDEAA